jgi:hypothetical protein
VPKKQNKKQRRRRKKRDAIQLSDDEYNSNLSNLLKFKISARTANNIVL